MTPSSATSVATPQPHGDRALAEHLAPGARDVRTLATTSRQPRRAARGVHGPVLTVKPSTATPSSVHGHVIALPRYHHVELFQNHVATSPLPC